jgi:hypothetical protein
MSIRFLEVRIQPRREYNGCLTLDVKVYTEDASFEFTRMGIWQDSFISEFYRLMDYAKWEIEQRVKAWDAETAKRSTSKSKKK